MARGVVICVLAWLCAGNALAQRVSTLDDAKLDAMLDPGIELVQRFDTHLNDDEEIDTVYVGRGADGYRVGVVLAYRSEGGFVHDALKALSLPGSPTLELPGNVLVVRSSAGGGTATAATYRYRYDPYEHEMILIGLDAERPGRIRSHDSIRLSWNLQTGAHVVEHGKIAPAGAAGDAAYVYGPPDRTVRRSLPVWMVNTPDPDTLLDAEIVPEGEDRD